MDIERFNKILQSLNGLNIIEGGFYVEEDGDGNPTTLVSGVSEDKTMGVTTPINDLGIPNNMGILSVLSVLNRLALFDIEKVGCEFEEQDAYVSSMTLKQGRRHALINTTDPDQLKLPFGMVESDMAVAFSLSKDYVDYISKAISSIKRVPNAENVEVKIDSKDGESYTLSICGGGDDFSDPLEASEVFIPANMEVSFNATGIQRTLKEAIKANDTEDCLLIIDTDGNAHIDVGELEAVVGSIAARVSLLEGEEATAAA